MVATSPAFVPLKAPSPLRSAGAVQKRVLAVLACIASVISPLLAAEISLESAPPVVVKTVPVAGATDVDPALTEIKVTYSKAMQDGSWSWVMRDKETYPEMTGDARYLQDSRTCVLPVKLHPNKFYAIWLNSDKFKNFTDTGGRPAVPYLLTFFTGDGSSVQSSGDSKPATWLREAGVDLNQLDPQNVLLTQVMVEEIQPDGNSRFRYVNRQINSGDKPQQKLQFQNSDFVDLQRLVDADGNPIPFTTVHSERHFRYSATLPKPVPPGGTLIYGSEGVARGKVSHDAQSGTFTYRFSHWPSTGVATRRLEIHRLPPGAEVFEASSNVKQRTMDGPDGRIELVLDQIVKPGGNVTLNYSYRLSTESAAQRRLKSLVEDFFRHNYRDITSRDSLEWGEVQTNDKGNSSIRYKYRAKIWDKNTITNDQVFTFDSNDKFVSVKNFSAGSNGASSRPANEVVARAMDTISQCVEGDPRVAQELTQLRALPEHQAVAGLVSYLDSPKNTIRRSGIYALQNGGFGDITPAVPALQRLLAHQEDLTRGMAALALGQYHVQESFETLAKMTREDSSGYARRCAAYALGLMGDPRAEPTLKAALTDTEAMVRNNAKAALGMLKADNTQN